MKKKLIFFISSIFFAFFASFPVSAESAISEDLPKDYKFSLANAVEAFINCDSAIVGAVIFLIVLILLIVFRKKLAEKLEGSSSGSMLGVFMALFSFCGIFCLVLALMTDGKSWSGMMHIDNSGEYIFTQFSDYIGNMRRTSMGEFSKSASRFSPFALIVYLALAQFVPSGLVNSDLSLTYIVMMRNQSVMLLYLFLVLFTAVSVYKMNRTVLGKNGLVLKNDIVAIMAVFSYPVIYCIELGNLTGFSFALALFFVLFANSEKRALRETALVLLGVSAAITPYTLIFALLLFFDESSRKRQITDAVKTAVYFSVLFFIPAVFTGFGNAFTYVKTLVSIPSDVYASGNTSIANLLIFFGIKNQFILYIITALTDAMALLCLIFLKSKRLKATAAVYIILNIFGVNEPQVYMFILIPLMMLFSEKTHTAKDWLYLLSFSLLVLPIPTWYFFEERNFTYFLNAFGLDYTPAANGLFALAAVQLMLIIMCSQLVTQMKNRKQSINQTALK